MVTKLRLICLLSIVLIVHSVFLVGGHCNVLFWKNGCYKQRITRKNSIQMFDSNPCLATVLNGTVLLNVNKELENDTILVYERKHSSYQLDDFFQIKKYSLCIKHRG